MMQGKVVSVCLLFFLSFSIFSLGYAVAPGKLTGGKTSTHPDWFKDSFLEIASDSLEANEAGKHLILFMHLNGCPYCYKMLDENFSNAPYTQFIKDNFDVIAFTLPGPFRIETVLAW